MTTRLTVEDLVAEVRRLRVPLMAGCKRSGESQLGEMRSKER